MNHRWCIALIVSLAVSVGYAIDVNDPPQGTFVDEWYAIMIRGQKSGHAHIVMERKPGKGRDVILTRTDMSIAAKRMNQTISVAVVEQSLETLDGQPLKFSQTMKMAGMPIEKVGRIRDGKITIDSNQLGQKHTATYDVPDGAIMSWGLFREVMKRGLKPGTKYELPIYNPGLSPDKLLASTTEILARETIDLFGRKVETFKTQQSVVFRNPIGQETTINTTSWITENGDTLRLKMDMDMMPLMLEACSRSAAMAPNDPAELMMSSLIEVDKAVNSEASSIHYRLSVKGNDNSMKLPKLPDTDIQKVKRQTHTAVDLVISQPAPFGQGDESARLSDKERKRYLADTSTLNYKDPVVAKLVKKAAGDEKDPWKLADKLRRFVTDYVSDKSLNVGFATASEVARSKEGDCSEHGVLLAAMGRGVGIPTRLVTGLTYVESWEGKHRIFGGHLWTQFWIDGRWIDLDAAQRQTRVQPTHIALSLSDGGESGIADLINSLWLNLGKLKVTVLEQK
jgi:hypothetical protein